MAVMPKIASGTASARSIHGVSTQPSAEAPQQSTAPNRQTDPMGWTQWMNALQAQAEELAMQQIYSL